MRPITIALDGPSASGKSTLSRLLAQYYGCQVVESGKYYRYVAWVINRRGVSETDIEAVVGSIYSDPIGWSELKDASVLEILRSDLVAGLTPKVAVIPEVREIVNAELRRRAGESACVVEGRDIGTAVFPQTPWKIYLNVPAEVRERRRRCEGSNEDLKERDRIDSTRKIAPLKMAEDAIILDILDQTPEMVCLQATRALFMKGLTAEHFI